MESITYLFGAGASCNCLPIYSNFNVRFVEFIEFVKTNINALGLLKDSEKKLKDELKFYDKELEFHTTPDTYAKKLFHTKTNDELIKFKNILILFFLYEQLQNFPKLPSSIDTNKQLFDKRYDAFIAALLKPKPGEIEFLENIQVLTWNYDLQFEIAFLQYKNNKDIHSIQKDLQSLPKLHDNTFAPLKPNNKLTLIHLNGIAYPKITNNSTSNFEDKIGTFFTDKKGLGNYLLKVYDSMQKGDNDSSNLSFAWESVDDNSKIKNNYLRWALEATENTETLIINGYSFPIFNRAIDAEFIQKMKSLKRIYIQDKYGAASIKSILETFVDSDIKKNIVDLGYYNQFHIPDERFKKIPPPKNISGFFF